MKSNKQREKNHTFASLWVLYFMLYFCIGILPVNIDNLINDLIGTTEFGIGMIIVTQLSVGTISIFLFVY